MADDVYKQRKKISVPQGGDEGNPLQKIQAIQDAVAKESGREALNIASNANSINPLNAQQNAPFDISGNMPPQFAQVLQNRMNQVNKLEEQDEEFDHANDRLDIAPEGRVAPKKNPASAPVRKLTPDTQVRNTKGSDALDSLLKQISSFGAFDEIELPSKSKFYSTIPSSIHVRPMTGEEENILATPRFMKKGKAMDMIFDNCIRENIDINEMLSIDRMYLLIFLRGISYTPEYDVEVKCPSCETKFNTMIDLNMLEVDPCPDDFGPENLEGVLPKTGLRYRYRLATGEDEQTVNRHREMRIREFGDQGEDDTLLYRSAVLLESIENVTDKAELMVLLRKLPVVDVNHLRNVISEPPFGVDTDVGLICPNCNEEFKIALPFDAHFFFPRKKETETQA